MVSIPTDFSTYFRTIIFLLGNLFILQHKWCQNFLTTVIFSYHNLYCTFVLTSVLYIYLYCSYLFTYVLYKRPAFPFHKFAPFLVLNYNKFCPSNCDTLKTSYLCSFIPPHIHENIHFFSPTRRYFKSLP